MNINLNKTTGKSWLKKMMVPIIIGAAGLVSLLYATVFAKTSMQKKNRKAFKLAGIAGVVAGVGFGWKKSAK